MLFSIIIPTYNRPKLLDRAIKSVLKQKYKNWELIIVDDASSYNITEQIEKFDDDRIKLIAQSKQERSAARNIGISGSKGEFVCFLDDDDEYSEDYLLDFYNYYENTKKYDTILRTGFRRIYEDKSFNFSVNYDENKHHNPVEFVLKYMCGVWALCIPKSYLIKNKFSEEFQFWEDTHIIARLLSLYPLVQLDSYNYNYYIHGKMGSNTTFMKEDIERDIKINIDAVNDLFDNYADMLSNYVKPSIRSKIISKTYLGAAENAAYHGKKKKSIKFLRLSLANKFLVNRVKSYILITILLVTPTFITRRLSNTI